MPAEALSVSCSLGVDIGPACEQPIEDFPFVNEKRGVFHVLAKVSGGTLDLSTFTANRTAGGGTLSLASGAGLKIGGSGTLPTNYSTHSINAASTIEYSGSAQTIATLNSVWSPTAVIPSATIDVT